MLRVSMSIMGIIVTTEGQRSNTRVLVANRVSLLDNIVIHLSCDCVTSGCGYPLIGLFSHCKDSVADYIAQQQGDVIV